MIKNPLKIYRFWEILPGLSSWMVIIMPLWASFIIPKVVAYLVIGFLIFWLYESFKTAILGITGFRKIKSFSKINWKKKYQRERGKQWLKWEKIKHIIIIPNYDEPSQKLQIPLESLIKQKNINKKQLIVVLAMEERFSGAHQKAKTLLKKYKGKFGYLTATFHPADIVGEIKGKASNEAWAGKEIKKQFIDKRGQDINYFTVTSCDADAHFHPHFFSSLTYFFGKNENRYLRLWQSPILWFNNIHKVPFPIKTIGAMGNIAYIALLQDLDQLIFNYSAYSLSLKLLDQIGYWDTNIIPEDWHLFLQSFFATKAESRVIPIFLPTSIDAPEGKTFFQALKNRYYQCQRHAWGATDIAYAVDQSFKHPEIPWRKKILRIYKVFKSHFIWTTNWPILTFGASLPVLLNPKFFQTSLGYNLPRFSQQILTICLIPLIILIILDYSLRPNEIKPKGIKNKIAEFVAWFAFPLSSLFMSVIPGLDAHTRLMLGKRLEYKVTKKY